MELMTRFELVTSSLPKQFSLFYPAFSCCSLLIFLLYMQDNSSFDYRCLLYLAATFHVVVFLSCSGFVVVNFCMKEPAPMMEAGKA